MNRFAPLFSVALMAVAVMPPTLFAEDTPTPAPTAVVTATATATATATVTVAPTATPTGSPTATATATATPAVTPAGTATPTPAASPTLTACGTVQSCIEAAVPTAVAQCRSATSACTETNGDKYAVTAGQLASRSLDIKRCRDAFARKSTSRCNACYRSAIEPLRRRFKGDLFHGLLGHAVKLIDEERVAVCTPIGRGGKRKKDKDHKDHKDL